ncbi:MAG: leucyl-tRNA synthetase [Cyclobacteriaceae bacterium]|jgi:leucyl-tRNA synthetase
MAEYNFLAIQKKWKSYWEDQEIYKVSIDESKPKYYVLDMFPYPSGAGLHVGHPLGYIATDIVSRYKRLKGYNVLHPMGFDSFGLPAEQYAIQTGQHPALTTEANITRYKEQLTDLGFSYDWSREVRTSDPQYYKWTQWIFKQLFNSWYSTKSNKAERIESLIERFETSGNSNLQAVCDDDVQAFSANEWSSFTEGTKSTILLKYRLTYISETNVNWCPELGTVLSNDEVKDGFSERGGHPVVKKKMPQWSMRITAYADRLLEGLNTIDWPEPIKEIQRNWIGKSIGAEIDFEVEGYSEKIRVFTTRIDTIYGVTFLTLAPEIDLVQRITSESHKDAVSQYIEESANRSERERMSDVKHISGVFTGAYAVNPFNNENIPIWIADYVLAGYGTGAVMAVPSGDQRDYDFAKHFDLPIVPVYDNMDISEQADPTKDGKMINSGLLNGLDFKEATSKAIKHLLSNNLGDKKINYRLRDAIFGRQRYWGEPFPVYFDEGLPQLINDDKLPIKLPEVDKYLPTEDGEPPLARAKNWKYEDKFDYELTTMPGWAGSSWYFFRYMDPTNEKAFASPEALRYWKSVDLYTGGSEHATGHLLYSRFWTKFLYDLEYIAVDEYAEKLINQGMIQGRSNFVYRVNGQNKFISKGLIGAYKTTAIHVDVNIVKDDLLDIEAFKLFRTDAADAEFILENGKYICGWEVEKMSKSKYNVVNPDDLVQKYGADTLRMYEMFLGPIEQSKPWNTNGIEGVFKFLKRLHSLFYNGDELALSESEADHKELKVLHGLLKKVASDVETLSLNTSVSSFMIAVNELLTLKCNKRQVLQPLTIALAPFAPFLAEELWHQLGNSGSIFNAQYPEVNESYLKEDEFEYPVSVNGKMRVKLKFPTDKPAKEIEAAVLNNEVIKKWLDGKSPKKVIVVPNRIVNVVM